MTHFDDLFIYQTLLGYNVNDYGSLVQLNQKIEIIKNREKIRSTIRKELNVKYEFKVPSHLTRNELLLIAKARNVPLSFAMDQRRFEIYCRLVGKRQEIKDKNKKTWDSDVGGVI